MSSPVGPATSFQIDRQFSEENQGVPVPASVWSVAFPSADEESIRRNPKMRNTRSGFAHLIHDTRWIIEKRLVLLKILAQA